MYVRDRTAIVAALTAALACESIFAQETPDLSRPGVHPQIATAGVYDDNVLWTPSGGSDFVWRVSPEIRAERKTAKVLVHSLWNMDAERFQEHSDLTTPLARLTTSLDLIVRATARTAVEAGGGYQRTATPVDLNDGTGLAAVRTRASVWHGAAEIVSALNSLTRLGGRHEFSRQSIKNGLTTQTYLGEVWLSRQVGRRDEIQARAGAMVFDPGAAVQSETVLVGWTRRFSEKTTAGVRGGPRYTLGSFRPELAANIVRRMHLGHASLSYVATQAVAVGFPELVDVQRAEAEVTYRSPKNLEATLQGAAHLNTIGTNDVYVYRLSASIGRPIVRTISVSIGYDAYFQRGSFGQHSPGASLARTGISLQVMAHPPRSQ